MTMDKILELENKIIEIQKELLALRQKLHQETTQIVSMDTEECTILRGPFINAYDINKLRSFTDGVYSIKN